MNYEQIEAYLATKCAEVSHAAQGDYCSIRIEAECSIDGKITVAPAVYTASLGHYGVSILRPRPASLEECVQWVKNHSGQQLAKEKRALAASLIAQAEQLEAQP